MEQHSELYKFLKRENSSLMYIEMLIADLLTFYYDIIKYSVGIFRRVIKVAKRIKNRYGNFISRHMEIQNCSICTY